MSSSLAVGVLGGMGPAATVDFFSRVVRATSGRGQDQIRLIIDNNPTVPDRQAAIAGAGPSPGAVLAQMARGLEHAGANCLVMPCNTAHAFRGSIKAAVSVPFIDMIEVTAAALRRSHPAVRRVGLLATNGCINAELYPAEFEGTGVIIHNPRGATQDTLMTLLNGVESGETGSAARRAMLEIATSLVVDGADAIIAGCTEVPLLLNQNNVPVPLIVSTDALVDYTISYVRNHKQS